MADVAKREREGHFKSLSKPGSQLAERIQAMQDGFGVICLSEKNDDLLMWAHYGDSHRGICLEFEVARSSIFSRAKPVKYATTFPVLNGFTQSDDELRDGSVLSKSRHWRYEKEWRIVFKGIRSYPFPPELLTGVIFGCQASEETKTEVKRLLAGRNPPVHLFQCVRSDRRFELEIKKLR